LLQIRDITCSKTPDAKTIAPLPSITEWTPAQRAAKVSEEMLSNYDDGTVTRGWTENDQGVANTIVLKRANSPTQTTAVTAGLPGITNGRKILPLVYQHNGKQDQHVPHRRKSKPALPPRVSIQQRYIPAMLTNTPPVKAE